MVYSVCKMHSSLPHRSSIVSEVLEKWVGSSMTSDQELENRYAERACDRMWGFDIMLIRCVQSFAAALFHPFTEVVGIEVCMRQSLCSPCAALTCFCVIFKPFQLLTGLYDISIELLDRWNKDVSTISCVKLSPAALEALRPPIRSCPPLMTIERRRR